MAPKPDPYLTAPDAVVLDNLLKDIQQHGSKADLGSTATSPSVDNKYGNVQTAIASTDERDIQRLIALNDKNDPYFQATVFTTWDEKDIPPVINTYVIKPYIKVAQGIMRHPTDVVFLTHLLLLSVTSIPSALYLYHHFTWIHGFLHAVWSIYAAGPFTLLMHNHIHNNGILSKRYSLIDRVFPYVLEPLMGHTWDSYYYHHVKHHHVEGNGPDDLSSTIRYQRDDWFDFACYVGRFWFFIWLELPLYFLRKGKPVLALKAGGTELLNYAFFYYMATRVDFHATLFVLLIPFGVLRIGLMVGNWGQHALVDEIEPDSDFRSSITLIDVASNRFCFNDGYHTAHHLNPRRHWRDQPLHFVRSKEAYINGRALVFTNIDYIFLTIKLLQKDYLSLAKCLVPIGEDQMAMTEQEIADMLRTKTKKFTDEDIRQKFAVSSMQQANKQQQGRGAGWLGHRLISSWFESGSERSSAVEETARVVPMATACN